MLGAKESRNNSSLLDMGITYIPEEQNEQLSTARRALLEPLVEPIFPMGDFQRYRAILDIDGNSWSSRFGLLMCYNSVILKVEPKYVDYFFDSLQPWVHYVPVQYDLSDLITQAAWVLDPRHAAAVQKIIAHANQWCQEYLIEDVVARDLLTVWDAYVELLERGDPEWQSVWESRREAYFAALDMVPLSTNY